MYHCLINNWLTAAALEEMKIRNLTRLSKLLLDKTVMLYFPHMVDDHGTCNAAFKMLAQYDQVTMTVHDQMEVQLTKENISEVRAILVFVFKCSVVVKMKYVYCEC